MKKFLTVSLSALLIIVLGPVLFQQLRGAEQRVLEGETLDATRFEEIRFRNEAQSIDLGANRWYLTLTHFLQDNGILVLLPDKRGSEKSGGDWHHASFEDLATDTAAAIRFLETQRRVKISRIGLIGMSQGGWIAPIVASQSTGLSYLVSVVGSAVTTHQQFLYEEDHNLRQLGVLPGISGILAGPTTFISRNWLQRDFWSAVGDFDPLPYWSKLELPALALFGEVDTNVPSARSAERLRGLNKPGITVRIYEGSGHALQDSPGNGNSLLREDALTDIRDFILAVDD